MNGWSSSLDSRDKSQDGGYRHNRPGREDVLKHACPKYGALPQSWCHRVLGKDLKRTTRNVTLMAGRNPTPPSHLERYRLAQGSVITEDELEKRRDNARNAARNTARNQARHARRKLARRAQLGLILPARGQGRPLAPEDFPCCFLLVPHENVYDADAGHFRDDVVPA